MSNINYNREIWEGWTIQHFIDELDITFEYVKDTLKTKKDVKEWCIGNQPYYKKHIPEVVKHYCNKLNIK